MKFKKLNSSTLVHVDLSSYHLNWEGEFVSKPQTAVKDFLEPYWKFDAVLGEFRIPGSKLRIDFLNLTKKIAIEVSPKSSHSFNLFFHKTRVGGFLAAVKRDQEKRKWIGDSGFAYVELRDEELKNLSEEIFKDLGVIL